MYICLDNENAKRREREEEITPNLNVKLTGSRIGSGREERKHKEYSLNRRELGLMYNCLHCQLYQWHHIYSFLF